MQRWRHGAGLHTRRPQGLVRALKKHHPIGLCLKNAPFLDRLVGYAIRYYKDFVLPEKTYRSPDARETAALNDLASRLEKMESGLEAEDYMTEVFSAGKENGYEKDELRDWFQAIYEVCLGQSQGPRFGSFIQLYGVNDTAVLIRDALDGKFSNTE